MYVSKITLNNYRVYYGTNALLFPRDPGKNVFIVSGNNGYGKTTLLTSLIWALYGKLMVDVDDKFRREIYEAGGYKKYANNNFNRGAQFEYEALAVDFPEPTLQELKENNPVYYGEITEELKARRSYSVSVFITDLHIPAFPCKNIEIVRHYDALRSEDTVKILIDGAENELTKEVGNEIFINDFILPKEIAKFFFFDAEKIVTLAEIRSFEEKKSLSRAYAEVLGIKKYEDLKSNLEDLRIRFRRNAASEKDRSKLVELQKEVEQTRKLILHNEEKLAHWKDEKIINKQLSEQLQEKLIREGNSLSVHELGDLKKLREKLTRDADVYRNKLRELLDIAPFAIAGESFRKIVQQHQNEREQRAETMDPGVIKKKLTKVTQSFEAELSKKAFKKQQITELSAVLTTLLSKHVLGAAGEKEFKVLLDLDEKESNELDAIYHNLKFSFALQFKHLLKEYKNNRINFNKVIRKISLAEAKEGDLLIKEIRSSKNEADEKLAEIEERILEVMQEIGSLQKELSIRMRIVSELSKKVELEEKDKEKDETAKRLIGELNAFIKTFKSEKKNALEYRIKSELNQLMHKKNFVQRVDVLIEEEIIDVNLYDGRGNAINKESLSKGEQQLYATALLKALVDESNIKFPVFIDSPLQKFDKQHSLNIINDFYPNISDQVVLFPLLEKELSEREFEKLLPKVNRTYVIRNSGEDRSSFVEIKSEELFLVFKKEFEDVYHHSHIA